MGWPRKHPSIIWALLHTIPTCKIQTATFYISKYISHNSKWPSPKLKFKKNLKMAFYFSSVKRWVQIDGISILPIQVSVHIYHKKRLIENKQMSIVNVLNPNQFCTKPVKWPWPTDLYDLGNRRMCSISHQFLSTENITRGIIPHTRHLE